MRSPLLRLLLVGLVALASAALIPGCGKQSVGMRCDYSPDCEDGLVCKGSGCCPRSGGTGLCAQGAVVTDSGASETSTDSGNTDSSTDSSNDASDSTADSASESGDASTDAADAD